MCRMPVAQSGNYARREAIGGRGRIDSAEVGIKICWPAQAVGIGDRAISDRSRRGELYSSQGDSGRDADYQPG
jgi:hypothetical protein